MTDKQKRFYDLLLFKLKLPNQSKSECKSPAAKFQRNQKTVLQILETVTVEKDNITENRLMQLLSALSIALK